MPEYRMENGEAVLRNRSTTDEEQRALLEQHDETTADESEASPVGTDEPFEHAAWIEPTSSFSAKDLSAEECLSGFLLVCTTFTRVVLTDGQLKPLAVLHNELYVPQTAFQASRLFGAWVE
jgi:hypothetical protein